MSETYIVGHYNDDKAEYYLFELNFTDHNLEIKVLEINQSPTKYTVVGKVGYDIPTAQARLENDLKKYATVPVSTNQYQVKYKFSVAYQDIENISLRRVFMSHLSYYCHIEFKTTQPGSQELPIPTMSGKNIGFLFNENTLMKIQSSFQKYCPGKLNLYYNKYKGNRVVKYVLVIATIWTWFIGFAGTINYPDGRLAVVLAGITMIFVTYLYCFRKNPQYDTSEDSTVARRFRLRALVIVLLIIFSIIVLISFLAGFTTLVHYFDLSKEVVLLLLVLIVLVLKYKPILRFLRRNKK